MEKDLCKLPKHICQYFQRLRLPAKIIPMNTPWAVVEATKANRIARAIGLYIYHLKEVFQDEWVQISEGDKTLDSS